MYLMVNCGEREVLEAPPFTVDTTAVGGPIMSTGQVAQSLADSQDHSSLKDNVIDPTLLRELVKHNPDTGLMVWKSRRADHFKPGKRHTSLHLAANWNSRHTGNPAVNVPDQGGYLCGLINRRAYKAHRVMWALHYGEWPDGQIDHINGERSDNSIENLRVVTNQENQRNRWVSRKNLTGFIGVTWNEKTGTWRASVTVSGNTIHLGVFKNKTDAIASRKKANAKYGFSESHGGYNA